MNLAFARSVRRGLPPARRSRQPFLMRHPKVRAALLSFPSVLGGALFLWVMVEVFFGLFEKWGQR